jgi:DNA-binding transcriptional MerR regulator
MSMNSQTWRVGELAEAAGLTVRTLHHYDRIGLLCPSLRNEGGHRVYTGDDARRLFQIVALRGLGLTLGQIQDCLTKKLDPRPLLAEQVRTLSAQIESGGRLRTRLLSLLEVLEQRNEPDGDDLLQLIQQTGTAEPLSPGAGGIPNGRRPVRSHSARHRRTHPHGLSHLVRR